MQPRRDFLRWTAAAVGCPLLTGPLITGPSITPWASDAAGAPTPAVPPPEDPGTASDTASDVGSLCPFIRRQAEAWEWLGKWI